MRIKDVLSLALEVFCIVVSLIDVPLQEWKTDMEEEPVPDLEGFVEKLMQPDDIREGDERNLEESGMRQSF